GEQGGAYLVSHPDTPGVSFTGSTETGRAIGRTCGEMHKRLSLDMGGKNAQIVFDDANIDLPLDGVLWGAFGTTGQRCTATSRLLLQAGIHDEFLDRLVARVGELRLGDGLLPNVDVGPLINEAALRKVETYVELGREEAELLVGGRRATGEGLEDGFFFEPTIFAGVSPGSRLATEEIFGPVLAVIRFETAAEAFRINNRSEERRVGKECK